ncbi:hypothetical protein NP493_127g02017 [Ridgeia piscesae]|uniref:EGF-like domain-containing protein n=1 Tax=Ridgeia piscesae TaxID=27915 RepID=A0AAD9P5P0_RIDPI|nr:hypothetical protein NP493_127g02017 [Ridgeia piscesae]
MHWFCDGERDCVDGSDEQAHCVPVSCSDEEFTCVADHQCIPKKWRCDRTNDCNDLSDEKDCDTAKSCTPEKGYYQCAATDQCFAIKFLCDGTTHCSDGSDEGGLCNETCTPRLCGHECHATPAGPLCYCREGYALDANNETCSDIDECAADPPVCSHYCTNTAGSFWCSCASGYTLQADARRCLPIDASSAILLYSTQSQIMSVSLKTKQQMVIQTHYNHPVDTGIVAFYKTKV